MKKAIVRGFVKLGLLAVMIDHRRGRVGESAISQLQINRKHSVRFFSSRQEASGRQVLDQPCPTEPVEIWSLQISSTDGTQM